jgi:hypothetical protein
LEGVADEWQPCRAGKLRKRAAGWPCRWLWHASICVRALAFPGANLIDVSQDLTVFNRDGKPS